MRLFFALWPDESTRERLDEAGGLLHKECGGKRTRRESIHLTLVFLGEVEAGRVGALLEAAGKISGSAFEIILDRTGYWRHNRIAWVGASGIPLQLAELVSSLEAALKAAGFEFDERPYFPHITLLRKAAQPKTLPEFEPVSWPVSEFRLVGSSPAGYVCLGSWAL